MGKIDKAVPFFGNNFNRIYPLIMVIYTLLVASNFFDRVIGFFGSWKRFRFQTEVDDTDGFDPSGVIILQKGKCTITSFLPVYCNSVCLKVNWISNYFLIQHKPLLFLFILFQNDLGWNKDKRLVSMLCHWQETLTASMWSLAAIVQYVFSS